MSVSNKKGILIILFLIVLFGFGIRIWNLAGPDMIADDALYAFRSIGYIDYVASTNKQSTPVSWFTEPQWWQYLSFHDNPPLVFAVQWIFFKIGGDNLWAARVPFVLAGVLSIIFLFLLGKYIAGETAGIIAAGILATMNYAVWISRIGLLDGFVMMWVILSLFFFLKAKEHDINYIWWALAAGAGLLSKYTFIFMLPLFFLGLVMRQREAFRRKNLYIGLLLLFLLLLPLLAYNTMMWKERGHPDAALSSLFGIETQDFSGLIQRSISKNLNIASIGFQILKRHASAGMEVFIGLNFCLFLYLLWRQKQNRSLFILALSGLVLALLMLGSIGASERYNVVTLPFFILIAAIGASWLWQRLNRTSLKMIALGLFLLVLLWELFFTFQNQLIARPIIEHKAFLTDIYTRPRWIGYNTLDSYVEEFYEKYPDAPPVILFTDEPQLARYQLGLFERRYPDKHIPAQTHLLLYDDRMDWTAAFWTFERRKLYDIAPTHSISQFLFLLRSYGTAYYTDFGFTDATFIITTEKTRNDTAAADKDLKRFADDLSLRAEPIDTLLGPDGTAVFTVYRIPF